jgi:RNA polymerase sigma-70 factor (ECF subfamily)
MDLLHAPTEFENAIVDSYADLLRVAKRLCRNDFDAQDLVHETVERGLRRRNQFRVGTMPRSWLVTILHRIFIDQMRKARHPANGWSRDHIDDIPAPDVPPTTPAEWEEFTIEDVRMAVLCLAPHFRKAYTMFCLDGLSQVEISRRLSLAPETVASRVFKARRKLRALLTSGRFRVTPIRPASHGQAIVDQKPPLPERSPRAGRRRALAGMAAAR